MCIGAIALSNLSVNRFRIIWSWLLFSLYTKSQLQVSLSLYSNTKQFPILKKTSSTKRREKRMSRSARESKVTPSSIFNQAKFWTHVRRELSPQGQVRPLIVVCVCKPSTGTRQSFYDITTTPLSFSSNFSITWMFRFNYKNIYIHTS